MLRSRSSQGIVGDRAEERLESIAVEVVHGGGRHRLLVEYVLAAPLLEQSGKFRRHQVSFGGPDSYVVAPTRGSVHVQSPGNHRHQDPVIDTAVTREQHLADDRSDRRVAVVGCDVEKPVLCRIQTLVRNPAHPARIIDTKEDGTPCGVRERDELTSELFRIGRQHASIPETHLLELGATVLTRAKLIQNLLLGIEHPTTLLAERPAN